MFTIKRLISYRPEAILHTKSIDFARFCRQVGQKWYKQKCVENFAVCSRLSHLYMGYKHVYVDKCQDSLFFAPRDTSSLSIEWRITITRFAPIRTRLYLLGFAIN